MSPLTTLAWVGLFFYPFYICSHLRFGEVLKIYISQIILDKLTLPLFNVSFNKVNYAASFFPDLDREKKGHHNNILSGFLQLLLMPLSLEVGR